MGKYALTAFISFYSEHVTCVGVCLFVSGHTVHSAAGYVYFFVTHREREKERLERDSCETQSVSLGKSGSSRITVSCVYSCGTHTHTQMNTHIWQKITQTCTLFCIFMHVASRLLHAVLKGAIICTELVSRVLFKRHFSVCGAWWVMI